RVHRQALHPIAPCWREDAPPVPRHFAIASVPKAQLLRGTATAPCPWDCETASNRALRENPAPALSALPVSACSSAPPADRAQLIEHLMQRALDQLRDLICLEPLDLEGRAVHHADRVRVKYL